MKASRRGITSGAAALLLTRGALGAGDAGDLLARVARARLAVKTLHGPFEQTRTVGLLATDVRSRGWLTLVCPERLRWELSPPDDVTFWVGPEGLAYRSAHGQGRAAGSTADIASGLDDLRALIGGDITKLRDRWDLRVTKDDASGAELEATPKAHAAAHLERLRFSLAPDLVRPTRVLLVEGPRDRTTIEFGALVVNGPVDDGAMRAPG